MTASETEVKVSVCVDCARHSSLKRIIEARAVIGTCAFCCRTDVVVRDPDDIEPMVMLMRALIRFYWDETAYNPHWGGDNVLDLFDDDANHVVKPPIADTYRDEFDWVLQEPAYPDWDKGIAIYAGSDEDGLRGINFAISRRTPGPIWELHDRLRTEDPADVRPALDTLIAPFLGDIAFTLPKGTVLFRARVGVEASYRRMDAFKFESQIFRQPYRDAEIGASPTPGDGRLNRAGHPVLYLGSKPYTALAEIRPHPGHYVSIGGFETQIDLRMADFDPDIVLFATSDERLSLYEIIQTFDRMMSTPVTPDDKAGYRLTQLLAEVLAARGFDGVQYRSSVSDGVNFCLFDPTSARFINGFSEVQRIKAVHYDAQEVASLITPGPQDYKISPKETS